MVFRKTVEVTPTTITNLTIIVKDDSLYKVLTLDDFTLSGGILSGAISSTSDDTPISIYSEGYAPQTTTYGSLGNINLVSTNDFSVFSNSSTNYNCKDSYGRSYSNDMLEATLNLLYPIGSIYIGTMATCPLETLGIGTWQLVSSGRVLQGADSTHTAGSTIAAGLPEISGNIYSRGYTTQYSGAIISANGAFSYTKNAQSNTSAPVSVTGTSIKGDTTQFQASNSNSIYGNSTTVQPPAYAVNIWERIS